jgi:hypothetical protein
MKTWFCICILMISLMVAGLGFCQQEQAAPETHSKQGTVTQIDSIGSLLVISDGNEELRFNVGQEAKIQRGIDNITLDDLESNDVVNVEYYKTPDGVLNAVSIVDNNITSSF